jgi:DNA-binding CsgD family transcriptional regulator
MSLPSTSATEIIELAHRCQHPDELRRELLALVCRRLPCDSAVLDEHHADLDAGDLTRETPGRLRLPVAFGGRPLATLVVERRTTRFDRLAEERLRSFVPALGIAWAAALFAAQLRESQAQLAAFRDRFATLSKREREVALYLKSGITNRDIAQVLGTSPNTVRNQTIRIFEKTGANGRVELALWLDRAGMVAPAVSAPAPAHDEQH